MPPFDSVDYSHSVLDSDGTLICANLEQTNPYHLNIGFNSESDAVSIDSNTEFYPSLQLNTIRYSSQYPTDDFPTSGDNSGYWTPSETGLYLVNVRLALNSSSDELWEYNVRLVTDKIGFSEVEWVRQIFRSDNNDEDFRYLSTGFSTIVRVVTVGERYRLKIKGKTSDNSQFQVYKNPTMTCMEITKLG